MTDMTILHDPYAKTFRSHRPWQGLVPAGYTANFLGSLARIDRLYPGAYIAKLLEKAALDYFETTSLPHPKSPSYYEMGAILMAVDRASGAFNMLELGAGTGPWTASAACGAAARGIRSRFFLAVEAEPTRHEWLRENLARNGIRPDELETIRAVVFPSDRKDMKVYFPVGAPLFAGHGVRSSETDLAPDRLGKKVEYVGRTEHATLEAAPVVSLRELLLAHDDKIFDVAHIDIQGVEDQVIADAADVMHKRLRSVAIGTHGRKIEDSLRQTFEKLGWSCICAFGTNSTFHADGVAISTDGLDGFQHWINPGLT